LLALKRAVISNKLQHYITYLEQNSCFSLLWLATAELTAICRLPWWI